MITGVMKVLDIAELLDLEEIIRNVLDERLEEILTKLNRTGQLKKFLSLIGMSELLDSNESVEKIIDGTIIVIGQSDVDKEKLSAVAKNLGFEKSRFEFYLDYNDAKTFDFKKIQWSDKYSCILVGQMPHSGYAKGDFSSIITALEKQDGYPPVVRGGVNGLKITKSSFKDALRCAIENNYVST